MINLSFLSWEIFVGSVTALLLLADLFCKRVSRLQLGQGTVVILGSWLVLQFWNSGLLEHLHGNSTDSWNMFVMDGMAWWGKFFFLATTLTTLVMALRYFGDQEGLVEHMALQLMACMAMMLLTTCRDFISLFVCLELMAVSFYVLVGFHSREIRCLEAGLKYLIYSALASGVMLYGITLIYGSTSEVRFSQISAYVVEHPNDALPMIGLALVLVGVAFKISAFPFHWWTPDVYEGAPTPTVALLSTGSKGAGFVILIRILFEAFPSCIHVWMPMILFAAGASILWGNLGALYQGNLKRLMGYSSISHSGYLLMGIGASSMDPTSNPFPLSAVLYYLLAYSLASSLIFLVMCETNEENPLQEIRKYDGLHFQSRGLATGLTLGLLSLAGIPPLAGFIGKLLLLKAAFSSHLYLVISMAAFGILCSFYYYLGIIRTVFFGPAPVMTRKTHPDFILTKLLRLALILMLLAVGLYQTPWWEASLNAIKYLQP